MTDGRAKLARLTERGRRAQAAGREIVAQVQGDWAEALGTQKFATLRTLLEELRQLLWPPINSGSA